MAERLIVLNPATYTLTQSDGTDSSFLVASKVAGTISDSAPNIGDTLTVTGRNDSALAAFRLAEVEYRWEKSTTDSFAGEETVISGATDSDLNTSSGVTAGDYVRGGWRGPNDSAWAFTPSVQVTSAPTPTLSEVGTLRSSTITARASQGETISTGAADSGKESPL